MLRWSPSEFRGATVWEVAEAYEGYALSKGIRKPDGRLTPEEIRELRQMMDEYGDA